MKKRLSIKWKIAAYLSVFAICLIVLLSVFQTVLLEPMYERYKKNMVRTSSDEISSVISTYGTGSDELIDTIYKVSAQNDTCVRILSGYTDEIKGNVGCVLYRMNDLDLLKSVTLARDNGGEFLSVSDSGLIPAGGPTNYEEKSSLRNLTLTRITQDRFGEDVIIMVYSGLTPVNATTQTLRLQMVYISILIALAMLLLVYLLNRNIARPLTAINKAASSLPQGLYTEPEGADSYQEAKELNQTLSQAARDIHRADKAKKDLISNVSHDLRTPLTMISGYAEMMRDLPGEKTDENLNVIIDETRRLSYLVNDLLDLSRLEGKRMTLQMEDFDISAVLQEELKKYEVYRIKEGVVLQEDLEQGLIVHADRARIFQVFHNFMTNAIHYSPAGSPIEIKVVRSKDMAKISVTDHGEGIDNAHIDEIWERYYKLDHEHVRTMESSGIGLAIVKEILQLHNVPFGVQSELHKGSTFWFELPLTKNTDTCYTEGTEVHENERTEGHKNI